jgi:putative endonuclease
MPYFVYILFSRKIDRYYIGSTAHLDDRILRHNQGRSKATKSGAPLWTLVFSECFSSRSEAAKREFFLKRMKSRSFIENLISQQ